MEKNLNHGRRQLSQLFRLYPLLLTAAIAVPLSAFLAYQFVERFKVAPGPFGDARVYIGYGLNFKEYGLFQHLGTLRTYAYPLFLYLLTPFGSGFKEVAQSAGVAQYIFWVAAVVWLANEVKTRSVTLAIAVLVGGLVNPRVISDITVPLTEGLTLAMFVAILALLLRVERAKTLSKTTQLFGVGSLVAGAAVMVRPANIVILITWALTGVLLVCRCGSKRQAFYAALAYFTIGLISIAISMGPQLAYNLMAWGHATAMPVCNLGGLQVLYGIQLWKYDTTVSFAGADSLTYPNQLLAWATTATTSLEWYAANPLVGAITLVVHTFNAFSVSHLYTYIDELRPAYQVPLNVAYWTVLLLGFWHGLRRGWQAFVGAPNVVSFLFLSLTGIIAMNSITAVEVRFNLIPIAMICSLGLHWSLTVPRREFFRGSLIAMTIALILWVPTSWMLTLGGTSVLNPVSFDMSREHCLI